MAEMIKKVIRDGEIDLLEIDTFEECGLDLDSPLSDNGYSAIHWACHYGRAEVLQRLMDMGADVHCYTPEQGWTAAHICAIRGCTTCINVICSTDLDLCQPDSRGYHCSHLASAHGKASALQAIVKAGVNISLTDSRGWNIVHHAAFHGRLNILQVVNGLSVDGTAPDVEGNTPAHLAAREGHLDCLKLLLHNKPLDFITSRNNNGATARDVASQFLKQDCVDFLTAAEHQADVIEYGNEGEDDYPGIMAASQGNVALLRMLLEEGHVGVDDRDDQGSTATHKAAGNGHLDSLQFLIDSGANFHIKDHSDDTPFDVAKRFGQHDCVALLKSADPSLAEPDDHVMESTGPPDTTAQDLTGAGDKVRELEQLLDTARSHYRQLGGELAEDGQIEHMQNEHKQDIAAYEKQLERERERREELECDLDTLRKQLHESMILVEHYKQMAVQAQAQVSSSPDSTHKQHGHTHSRHRHKRASTSGGTFVRIGHV